MARLENGMTKALEILKAGMNSDLHITHAGCAHPAAGWLGTDTCANGVSSLNIMEWGSSQMLQHATTLQNEKSQKSQNEKLMKMYGEQQIKMIRDLCAHKKHLDAADILITVDADGDYDLQVTAYGITFTEINLKKDMNIKKIELILRNLQETIEETAFDPDRL